MNYFQEFFDSCIHIFRNAVDHAIEQPDLRVNSGKSEEGTIKVSFGLVKSDENSFLEFNVIDDGGGIDPGRVRNKLRSLNYPDEIISKSDSQIIYHIFDPYFSTSEQVSDISGRGVGLYDIKKNVEKLNGTIELQSRVGKGTIFSFLLPMPSARFYSPSESA
jgi:two-component system chemotaxis sensor kinase CheA